MRYIDCIYLTSEERARYTALEHEYLIEQAATDQIVTLKAKRSDQRPEEIYTSCKCYTCPYCKQLRKDMY